MGDSGGCRSKCCELDSELVNERLDFPNIAPRVRTSFHNCIKLAVGVEELVGLSGSRCKLGD